MFGTNHQKPCQRSEQTLKDLNFVQAKQAVFEFTFKMAGNEQPIEAHGSVEQAGKR